MDRERTLSASHALTRAITIIADKHNRPIQAIEFEDGSGWRFNVRFAGDNLYTFINLKNKKYEVSSN